MVSDWVPFKSYSQAEKMQHLNDACVNESVIPVLLRIGGPFLHFVGRFEPPLHPLPNLGVSVAFGFLLSAQPLECRGTPGDGSAGNA